MSGQKRPADGAGASGTEKPVEKNSPAAEKPECAARNYVYILQCADGSYYTGWTNDLEKRLKSHNAGTGGKYTRSHRPVELAYYEEYPEKEEAMRREYQIKQLTRCEKDELVRGFRKAKDEESIPECRAHRI